jgi:hypothetical protein
MQERRRQCLAHLLLQLRGILLLLLLLLALCSMQERRRQCLAHLLLQLIYDFQLQQMSRAAAFGNILSA